MKDQDVPAVVTSSKLLSKCISRELGVILGLKISGAHLSLYHSQALSQSKIAKTPSPGLFPGFPLHETSGKP